MKKINVTFVGDPSTDENEGPQVLKAHGHTFRRGEAKDISVSDRIADKFAGNSHFAVVGHELPKAESEETEETDELAEDEEERTYTAEELALALDNAKVKIPKKAEGDAVALMALVEANNVTLPE